ncbi:sphingosine hydroxylase [Amylostereum chailletii]|nr:sphingosine hydroxylase [Amylostereum chailletii]
MAALSVYPFYYTPRPSFFTGVSDHTLAVAAPIVAHWIFAGLFHILDLAEFKALERYRLHDSTEVAARNLVSRMEVVRAVIFQQLIQVILAIFWMTTDEQSVNPPAEMSALADRMLDILQKVIGQEGAVSVLRAGGPELVYYVYWWGIPVFQFFLAMFVMDTWQYFLHRAMHINKFLYKRFHSYHHRLYVPYAFGALYNHPLEGFLLDTLGAAIAESVSALSLRQASFFFVVSVCKTVDDHCGYSLPFDPLQMFSGNTADYHDIHHQVAGIKSNFSQPFFIHWDVILGTRMTRKEMEDRKTKGRPKTS